MAKKLYLQLNEPGSGEITYPLDSAMAADLSAGAWVPLDYNGTIVGGFWAETFEKVQVDSSEKGGRVLKVSGRGAMAVLDDAVVWDWQTPDLTNVRQFWVMLTPQSDPVMTHKGYILWQLLYEARDHVQLARHCWHDADGNHLLVWNFTQTLDSDGLPWDAAEVEYLEARTGISLLDVARQYAKLGQPSAGYVFDIEAVHDTLTNVTEFKIHQTPIGKPLVNALVHFRIGHNCVQVSDIEKRAEIRNAVLLQYAGGGCPYTEQWDVNSILDYRRRELFLNAANASTDTEGDTFALAQLRTSKDPTRSIAVKVSDAPPNPKYGTDYNLGDWIYYDDGTGVEVPYRIVGCQLDWDEGFAEVTVELNSVFMENEIRSAKDLRKVGSQVSGSDLLNVSTSEGVVAGSLVHPPSGDAAKGQVLTADGMGKSGWADVDGGSGLASGTANIISLLHMQANFDDDIGIVWSDNVGTPTIDTIIKKWGAGSGQFIATAGRTGEVGAIHNSDFCVEGWIRPNAPTAGRICMWSSGLDEFGLKMDASYHLVLRVGVWDRATSAMAFTPGVWNHFACTRVGAVFYMFLNGFLDVNNFGWGVFDVSDATFIWGNPSGATGVVANLCECVVWNNAHYVAPFIPPTTPYVLTGHTLRGTVIEFRRGPAADLPPLFPGEPYIEEDTGVFHIGDDFVFNSGGALADHDHSGGAGDGGQFDAANLTAGASADGEVLTSDGVGGAAWEAPGGGVSEFHELTDTFEYAGLGGQFVKVNAAENALETAALAGGGDVLGPATSTDEHLAVWDGTDSKTLKDGGAVPAGGGGRVLISEQTPTGTGTVTFSSIPATYNKLVIEFVCRSTAAYNDRWMSVAFNDDATDANYRSEVLFSYAGAVGHEPNANRSLVAGVINGSTSPAGEFSHGTIRILEYANANIFKHTHSHAEQLRDTSSVYIVLADGVVVWENTSAITKIALTLSDGNYDTYSVFRLYGEY